MVREEDYNAHLLTHVLAIKPFKVFHALRDLQLSKKTGTKEIMGLPTDHAMTIAAQGSINDQEKKKKNLKGFTISAYSYQLCMFVAHCNTDCCQLK